MPTADQNKQQPQQSKASGNPFGVTENKFWNFIPATGEKPPELLLYGAISSQQSWWEDRVTPQQFNQELAALGEVPEIIVRINSGGGDVFAANAIFTRLKDCSAKITVKIDGWAASAATIIAMAGDSIKIARNGVFMIHDPAMTVWDTFRAEDFLKMADELKVIKQSIVNTYAMKTGRQTEDIEQLMSNETWWTGESAVENGFCDELMFEESSTVVENSSKIVVNSVPIDVSMFQTVPKQLLNSPHNPGSLINSATKPINKPKEEKEETKMGEPQNSITTVDALKAAYPDLVATIQKEATDAERARIKGIKDLAGGNYDAIATDAMFEHPITAEQMAVKIVAEQNKQGGTYIADRAADASASGANGVAGTAGEAASDGEKNVFDAAIDKLFPDVE
ncbi:MAG: Clp protease ClpP [Phascolarctobacterium sp.]|nr:Clp protease ClpP [Candidatus Phascolarctobacterium caballi]